MHPGPFTVYVDGQDEVSESLELFEPRVLKDENELLINMGCFL